MLFITAVSTDNTIAIIFEGDMDMFSIRSFHIYYKKNYNHTVIPFEEFEKDILHKYDIIALDLSKVAYIDSTGLRFITDIIKKYRPLGKKIGVNAISKKAEDLFKLIDIQQFIQL